MRVNAFFMSRFKLIWVVQSPSQKYFACAVGQINATDSRVLLPSRGALRDRHERWVRDAMDAAVSLTSDTKADGEVVWS